MLLQEFGDIALTVSPNPRISEHLRLAESLIQGYDHSMKKQPRFVPREPAKHNPFLTAAGLYIAADILSGGQATPLERAMFVAEPFVAGYFAQLGAEHGARDAQSDPNSL